MIVAGADTGLDPAPAQAAPLQHFPGRDAVVTVSLSPGDRARPPARVREPDAGEIELAFWTGPIDYVRRLPGTVRALSNGRNT